MSYAFWLRRLGVALALLLAGGAGAVGVLDGAWGFRQPLAEGAGAALFRQPDVALRLVNAHNVLGFDLLEDHELWVYAPTAPVHARLGPDSPLPRRRFRVHGPTVLGQHTLGWRPTGPGVGAALAHSLATSPALDRWPGSRRFARRQYLAHPGNLYATATDGLGGAYLYVWAPAEQMLFVLFDSRGAYFVES